MEVMKFLIYGSARWASVDESFRMDSSLVWGHLIYYSGEFALLKKGK